MGLYIRIGCVVSTCSVMRSDLRAAWCRLMPDEMLNTAAESTGYSDFGDEHRWEEGYRAMVAALAANAALTVFGRLSARGEILRNLQTRLRLVDLWQQHPEFITMHELRSDQPCELPSLNVRSSLGDDMASVMLSQRRPSLPLFMTWGFLAMRISMVNLRRSCGHPLTEVLSILLGSTATQNDPHSPRPVEVQFLRQPDRGVAVVSDDMTIRGPLMTFINSRDAARVGGCPLSRSDIHFLELMSDPVASGLMSTSPSAR